MSYVAAQHVYRIKLGTKLIRSLRLLWLGQGRSYYKGGGGGDQSDLNHSVAIGSGCVTRWGGGGSGTQKCVPQKWPDKIFPMVNFAFSHDGHPM